MIIQYLDVEVYNQLVIQAEKVNTTPEAYLELLISEKLDRIKLNKLEDYWLEEE